MKGRTAAAAGLAAAAAGWAVRDYRAWKALGPAGMPANPAGWLAVTGMRLRARDPYTFREAGDGDVSRLLISLDPRPGERPEVAPHPVPHRVLTQHAGPAETVALQDAVAELAERPGFEMRLSDWEQHHPALSRVDGPELAHVHPSDGSAHVVLSPLDARVVVGRRWGEFHPLAGVAPALPFMPGLPAGYVLLYPPQDAAQVARLATIVEAATG
ncbi:hypothetical protein GCM10009836_13480 [Pseudonocardia ailaonensis]|uniref:Luciferase domain-containing protein n=1 Tax=Pseudonocardia ailaonensis TaxID=367279 RepID=A0ABN2MV47_9PSEU